MSNQVIILPGAEEDLVEAEDRYEIQRPGLALEFRAAVEDGWLRVAAAPEAGSPLLSVSRDLGTRFVLLQRFPYSLVYIRRATALYVVAFAHHRRRPGYWRGRMEDVPKD